MKKGDYMLKEEIEIIRKKLNTMISSEKVDKNELLRVSEELDVLLLEYMKQNSFKSFESISSENHITT